MENSSIVIAGGSGFIGTALSKAFNKAGFHVIILTRYQTNDVPSIRWDGKTLGRWTESLENSAAVINLSGRSINCRMTAVNKAAILSSRIDSTQIIGKAIHLCKKPPALWINASSIGYYGETGEQWASESSGAGHDFLAEVTKQWEAAQISFETPETHQMRLRLAPVLGVKGGVLLPLVRLTRLGLGGAAGNGRQWFSWVHIDDLVRITLHAVLNPQDGAINVVAPEPMQNSQLMSLLRHHLHRPWSPPVPAPLIRLGAWFMNSSGELALQSMRISSERVSRMGFKFQYEGLDQALHSLL